MSPPAALGTGLHQSLSCRVRNGWAGPLMPEVLRVSFREQRWVSEGAAHQPPPLVLVAFCPCCCPFIPGRSGPFSREGDSLRGVLCGG